MRASHVSWVFASVLAACGGGSFEEGSSGAAGSGAAGSGTAGSGTAGSGTAGSGTAGSGTAGSMTAGSGTAGSGTAGSGTAGSATAGSGTAGSGTAGSGTAGSGTAGSGTAGSATTGGAAGSPWGPGKCDPLAPFTAIEALPPEINDPNPDNAFGSAHAWLHPSEAQIVWATYANSDIFFAALDAGTMTWTMVDDLKGSGSTAWDFFPSLLPDMKTMYLTSDRTQPTDYRLYVVTRQSVGDNFGNATLVDVPGRATTDREYSGQITLDGKRLYFASTRAQTTSAWKPTALDLYVLRNVGTPGAVVEPLANVNVPNQEDSRPALSADERVLYFASTRAGASKADIWVATRPSADMPFSAPVLVTDLQTAAPEGPSWISEDYCTLLFDRQGGTTGTRNIIYKATRSPN